MAVLIDTGIFVAARNRSDLHHSRAVELLKKALHGEYGTMYTSDFIFDEAVTVALVRTGNPEIAFDVGNFILSSRKLKMLYIDSIVLMDSWRTFMKYANQGLSFTDATSIALMKRYRIEYIMSFDSHFDGLVPRIC